MLLLYCPLDSWLRRLAEGWRFASWIVEPMGGHHGTYAVLMERDDP